MNRTVCVVVCGCFAALGAAVAGPRAGLVASTWQLGFDFHDPQRIAVRLPGDDHATTFWYVLYRVTNHTGKDVEFYPSFRVVTDTLEVVEGGAGISPSVYDAIAARHKKEFPFFDAPAKVSGPLMQGTVNSRTSAAVFRTFDTNAAGFKLYVSGLSGDIERVTNPVFDPHRDESKDNPRFFLLKRTLEVEYDLPGDPQTRMYAKPIRRNRRWVMR